MTDLGFIRVSADDLNDILTGARSSVERADLTVKIQDELLKKTEQAYRRKDTVLQNNAVQIELLQQFRYKIGTLLRLGANHPDRADQREFDQAIFARIVELVDREWQCGQCHAWVAGNELACPHCLPDPTAAETTSQFTPVTEPGDGHGVPDEVLIDLLALVGIRISPGVARTWYPEQWEAAADWARATHLHASDNDVTVPPRPLFLPDAQTDWQAPPTGQHNLEDTNRG